MAAMALRHMLSRSLSARISCRSGALTERLERVQGNGMLRTRKKHEGLENRPGKPYRTEEREVPLTAAGRARNAAILVVVFFLNFTPLHLYSASLMNCLLGPHFLLVLHIICFA